MSKQKGNNSELWDKLLAHLDDKLQLGLLDHLRRCQSYHFENDSLFIVAADENDFDYLNKDTAQTQLQLLAQDAVGISKLVIQKPND